MGQPAKRYYSTTEYLTLEKQAEQKSEYFRGEIYAMAGTALNHNRIVRNLSARLTQLLAGQPCEVFSESIRLKVQANGLYTYPDLMVICGPVETAPESDETVTNPLIIFEVLSASTSEYDRTDKFELYKALPSLQNYVLVDQHRAYIQCYRRSETSNSWLVQTFNGLDQKLELPAVNLQLNLNEIYERVELNTETGQHPGML